MIEQFLVKGKVQGVSYRWYTREMALQLKLNGFVRNLSDGSVEVLAEGEQKTLDQFYEWLKEGSPYSEVDAVKRIPLEKKIQEGFYIEKTL